MTRAASHLPSGDGVGSDISRIFKVQTTSMVPSKPTDQMRLGLDAFVQIAVGMYHVCGLNAVGSVTCWGADFHGQLDVPEPLGTIAQISAAGNHTSPSTTPGS